MRRLLAWGRQDPLCPAEAASPPPLSAFRSFCSSTSSPCSVLPVPSSKLFSDIERQLSAKLAADPPLSRPAQQQQPSPPTEAASSTQSSPLDPPTLLATTTAAADKASPGGLAAINNFLSVSAVAPVTAQQKVQNPPPPTISIPQLAASGPPQQQKGIDAFFAALANANCDANGEGGPSSVPSQQLSPVGSEVPNRNNAIAAATTYGGQQQQHSPIATELSSLCGQQQQATLAKNIQQAANNVLAANLFANAIAAQCQQQQPACTSNPPPPLPPLLANLKATHQQSAPQLFDKSLTRQLPQTNTENNNFVNSLQLVQQSTTQLQQQQQLNTLLAEQQKRNQLQQQQQQLRQASFGGGGGGIAVLLNQPHAGQKILRATGPGPSHSKPIPLLDERVDLLQFKRKEPREWSSDDVVAWILDVARQHQIPCENMNMTKFATCTGPLLMLMNEQSFKEHDPNFGSLLFAEFCKLVTDENFIDDWIKANAAVASSSGVSQQSSVTGEEKVNRKPSPPPNLLQQTAHNLLGQLAIQQEKQQRLVAGGCGSASSSSSSAAAAPSGNILLNAAVVAAAQHHQLQQQSQAQKGGGSCLPPLVIAPQAAAAAAASNLLIQSQRPLQPPLQAPIASLSRMLHPMQQQQQQQQGTSTSGIMNNNNQATAARTLMMAQQQQRTTQHQQMFKQMGGGQPGMVRGVGRPPGSKTKVEKQIRRNKDGRPRKRSQHTKGNKLWEFIRDALKDPRTCPSIVRWEDPSEGVFRIVESERLAFLWGQKKNNQKMTYEKLSRAMRTYYEKEILVPVPKSGLYPKKLVYKFGPTAHGWRAAATLAVQAHLALVNMPNINL